MLPLKPTCCLIWNTSKLGIYGWTLRFCLRPYRKCLQDRVNSSNKAHREDLLILSANGSAMSFRNNTLAIADQAVISLGNFATAVLLARILAPDDYGIFAMLFGVMLLLNSAHAGLVIYPLSLEAAVAERFNLARIVAGALIVTA